MRGTPASMATVTIVSAPLDRSGAPARMRAIAARIRSRSSGAGAVIRRPPRWLSGCGRACRPGRGAWLRLRGAGRRQTGGRTRPGFPGASAGSRSWVACWSVRAMLLQPGMRWSRLGVSLVPAGVLCLVGRVTRTGLAVTRAVDLQGVGPGRTGGDHSLTRQGYRLARVDGDRAGCGRAAPDSAVSARAARSGQGIVGALAYVWPPSRGFPLAGSLAPRRSSGRKYTWDVPSMGLRWRLRPPPRAVSGLGLRSIHAPRERRPGRLQASGSAARVRWVG